MDMDEVHLVRSAATSEFACECVRRSEPFAQEFVRRACDLKDPSDRDNLVLEFGQLPDKLGPSALPDSLAGVLCGDVLHFLPPELFRESLLVLFRALRPGGVFTGTLVTGYGFAGDFGAGIVAGLLEKYKDREFPCGFPDEENSAALVEPVFQRLREEGMGRVLDALRGLNRLYFYSVEVVTRELTRAGFAVMRVELSTHPGYPPPMPFFGRSGSPTSVVFAARKPTA